MLRSVASAAFFHSRGLFAFPELPNLPHVRLVVAQIHSQHCSSLSRRFTTLAASRSCLFRFVSYLVSSFFSSPPFLGVYSIFLCLLPIRLTPFDLTLQRDVVKTSQPFPSPSDSHLHVGLHRSHQTHRLQRPSTRPCEVMSEIPEVPPMVRCSRTTWKR